MALASEAPTSVFPTSRVFLNFEPLNLMFAIVDLETTGGIPENDQIIEVAIYHHDGEKITGSWSSLINPETVIPPFIARLTGISDVMVQKAPLFSAVAPQIAEMLTDRIFVAHNVMFDYSFLTHHLEQHGFPPIEHRLFCTCHSGRKLLPGYPSYSLGNSVAASVLPPTVLTAPQPMLKQPLPFWNACLKKQKETSHRTCNNNEREIIILKSLLNNSTQRPHFRVSFISTTGWVNFFM